MGARPLPSPAARMRPRVLRQKGYNGEIAVIPQFGVDPDMFAPCEKPVEHSGGLRIGYAGGLVPEKGVDLLLRAFADLAPLGSLVLAGEGEERETLERLAQELGIGERVTFLGRQASDSMAAFYKTLDVLVLPSRTQPNWKEQFGRVLVEAMSCAGAGRRQRQRRDSQCSWRRRPHFCRG